MKNKVSVKKSSVHGLGVFAEMVFRKGDPIAYFHGYKIQKPSRHSVTFEGDFVEPTGLLKYLNHAQKPNAYFKGRWLCAKRKIQLGEEIFFDYYSTEKDITHPFEDQSLNG